MAQHHFTSCPSAGAPTGPFLLPGLFNSQLACEFIPGRTQHFGMTDPSSNTTVMMPFRRGSLNSDALAPSSGLVCHLDDNGYATTASITSSQAQPSPSTSPSAFEGDIDVKNSPNRSSVGLPPNVPTGPLSDRNRQQQSVHTGIRHPQPPPNAPTGPSSQKKQLVGDTKQQLLTRTAESGLWSHTKTWISPEAQRRADFEKLMANLKHFGALQSPAIPRTPENYELHKEQVRVWRQIEQLQRKVNLKEDRQRTTRRREETLLKDAEDSIAVWLRKENETVLQRSMDKLSRKLFPLYSTYIFWNAFYTNMDDIPYEERVEWPPLAAFKKAGDGSSSNGSDRLLPQPRRNKSDDQMGLSQGDGMYEAGRSQTYRQNGIKEDYLGIVQSYLLAEVDEQDIVSEINMGKLPDSIRDVVNELDIVEKKEVEREGK